MARILGIDYGTKRIGLAISDSGGSIASPLKQVAAAGRSADDAAAVLRIADENRAEELLIGLPVNMDGTEGPQAKLTRAFADKLEALTARPVRFWDERLSSRTAEAYLAQADLTRKQKKKRRDAVAAQVILQSYLDRESTPPANRPPP